MANQAESIDKTFELLIHFCNLVCLWNGLDFSSPVKMKGVLDLELVRPVSSSNLKAKRDFLLDGVFANQMHCERNLLSWSGVDKEPNSATISSPL